MSPPTPPPTFLDRLRRFDPTVLPIVVAAVVLVGAVIWLLGRPLPPPVAQSDPQSAQQIADLRAGMGRLEALTGRVGALEGLSQRVGALEGITQRVAALEGRQGPDLGPVREQASAAATRAEAAERHAATLEERVAGLARDLAARPTLDPNAFAPRAALEQLAPRSALESLAPRSAVDQLTQRLETAQRDLQAADAQAAQRQATAEQAANGLAGRLAQVETLGGRLGTVEQALTARIAALEATLATRTTAIEQQAARLAALETAGQQLAGRASRLAAVDGVRGALESGQPLGQALAGLQDPPAPLARFATTPPPTVASLRLGFDEAVRAARIAGEPTQGSTVLESATNRLTGLLTVRRGGELVVGDAANLEIERARRALDAGDVEGALAALSKLSEPAKQAMRGWLDQAEALVAARAALRQLAAG